jgi:hypothetical protein
LLQKASTRVPEEYPEIEKTRKKKKIKYIFTGGKLILLGYIGEELFQERLLSSLV